MVLIRRKYGILYFILLNMRYAAAYSATNTHINPTEWSVKSILNSTSSNLDCIQVRTKKIGHKKAADMAICIKKRLTEGLVGHFVGSVVRLLIAGS